MKKDLFTVFTLSFGVFAGLTLFSQTALARPVWDTGASGTIQEYRAFIKTVTQLFIPASVTSPQLSSPGGSAQSPSQPTCSRDAKQCSGVKIQTCTHPVPGGFDWDTPRDCPTGFQCGTGPDRKAGCIKNPGTSVGPSIPISEWIRLTVGYGSGEAGNPTYITIGEGTQFYLHWQIHPIVLGSIGVPNLCYPTGTELSGGWQGSFSGLASGDRGPFSYNGTAPANYGCGWGRCGEHDFHLACTWPNTANPIESNTATVKYEYNPPQPTCTTGNECSPNQCWNLFQARPCTLDQATGCYKWAPASTIQNCLGGRCENGTCLGGGGGPTQPGQQPGQPGTQPSPSDGGTGGGGGIGTGGTPSPTCRPGFDPECTPPSGGTGATPPSMVPSPICTLGVDCPSGCTLGVDCPSGVTPPGGGGGGAGGGAGAVGGGPVFGATQCSDGVDNDKDGKIDYNGGYLLVDGRKVLVPPDPSCKDSSGQFDWRINSEGFHFREIIPDFFNLNWFKLNVADFFKAEALAK